MSSQSSSWKQVDLALLSGCVSNIEDGDSGFSRKQVFLNFYDPLFLNSDELQSIGTSASPQIDPKAGKFSEKIPFLFSSSIFEIRLYDKGDLWRDDSF